MVKIADFGVSHFSAAQHLSAPGGGSVQDPFLMDESDLSKFAGTPMFLAPEIISDTYTDSTAADLDQLATATSAATSTTMTKKKQPITKAIDIWAFGVTLYALLFGKLPFKADGEYQIYSVIRTEDWDVPETMGCDRLPVGGRHQEAPLPGQETEGYLVVALLDRLLQKEVKKRITLDDVKVSEIAGSYPRSEGLMNAVRSVIPGYSETWSTLMNGFISHGSCKIHFRQQSMRQLLPFLLFVSVGRTPALPRVFRV